MVRRGSSHLAVMVFTTLMGQLAELWWNSQVTVAYSP